MTIWEYISFRKFVSIKNYNHTSDITKFQTLQRIQSIPTLSRVLFCRGIDESRDRFKLFMESEPGGKVGKFLRHYSFHLVVMAPHYQKLWNA